MNKKLLLPGIIFCFITLSLTAQEEHYSLQITQLTTSIIEKTKHLENLNIGTVNFTNMNDKVTSLGKLLAEEVSGELSLQKTKLKIIDINRVSYWLEKENVKVADLSNPAIAERISKKATIDLMLMGTVLPLTNTCRLTLKIIDLKTGEVVAFERGNITLDETLQSLTETSSAAIPTKPEVQPEAAPVSNPINDTIEKEEFTSKSVPTPSYHDYTEAPKGIQAIKTAARGTTTTTTSIIKSETSSIADASYLPCKTEVNNLEFELRACKRHGDMVAVFFTLTNKSGDITLKIDDSDVIIYAPEFEQLALDNFRFNDDISIYVERTLTTGIPVQAQMIFNNVPEDAKTIDKLIIDYYAGRNEQIRFDNITIQ